MKEALARFDANIDDGVTQSDIFKYLDVSLFKLGKYLIVRPNV